MAKDNRLRAGSNTRDRGCTHGSVSAKSIPEEARSGSESIIWRDVVVVVLAMRVTGANADAVASSVSKN
jgi:hypothetical protein